MGKKTFDVTQQNFETEVLQSELPVLIEFTADWCPPCKMLAPIVGEIAQRYEGKLRVGLLDSDSNQSIVQKYDVLGLPTLLLFINGRPVERLVGFATLERIESRIVRHLSAENV